MKARLAVLAAAVVLAACTPGRDGDTTATTPPAGRGTSTTTATGAPPRSTEPSATTPPEVGDVRLRAALVVTLEAPLALAVRPGDPHLYVAEKGGRVRAVAPGGAVAGTVLDLSGDVSQGYEQGLLGLTFSPDGRHLYVNFTDRRGDTHVVEYQTGAGAVATAEARRELLRVDQPFANHNGGHLAFGRDGLLYLSLGDGGGQGDPHENAQRLDTLLGKLLRIDPRPSAEGPYRLPASNPFAARPGARGEIWAYGLRNPWRFSFDRETGDLWIGDVGQRAREEVDFAPATSTGGENYGWDRLEGTRRHEGSAPAGAVAPVHEYALDGGRCAITGGHVYRGERIAALRGVYLFADHCEGEVIGLVRSTDGAVRTSRLGVQVDRLASFGEDLAGELYVLSLDGGVHRLEPA